MFDPCDLLAAELAFGLLDGSELLEAVQRRLVDHRFAADVAKWESVAEAWLDEMPNHSTSPLLLARVAGLIAPGATAAKEPENAPAVSQREGGVWRPLAIAAGILVCLFAGLWVSRLGSSSQPLVPSDMANIPGRFSIAEIGGASAPHLATVLYDRAAGTLTIRIAAMASDPAKAPEIWLIDGTDPPHSLGFGQAGTATLMNASARLQRSIVGGATLAITLEPVSDHPHAAPSSKILGTGRISTL